MNKKYLTMYQENRIGESFKAFFFTLIAFLFRFEKSLSDSFFGEGATIKNKTLVYGFGIIIIIFLVLNIVLLSINNSKFM